MQNTTELAATFETTPRTLRKFLRADAKAQGIATPGKGSRYSLPTGKREVQALRKRFDAWGAAQAKTEPEAPEGTDES